MNEYLARDAEVNALLPETSQPLVDLIQTKRLSVEDAANPFDHFFMLRVPGVLYHRQEVLVSPNSAAVLRRARPLARHAHRITLPFLFRDYFLDKDLVRPTIPEIIFVYKSVLLSVDDLEQSHPSLAQSLLAKIKLAVGYAVVAIMNCELVKM